jgi:hypothetical protein
MCDHLHDQTSHYDTDLKLLSFLLVCPVCQTEQVVETLEYEPRFRPCLVPAPKHLSSLAPAATEQLPLAA